MTRSTTASSYDDDFFSWTQEQATALRRAGAFGDVEAELVAGEIEDLGKRDLREVVSFLELLVAHLLKIAGDPGSPSVPHWRVETRAFARAAARSFSPGMRRLIDVPAIWWEVLGNLAKDARDLGLPAPATRPCPFVLDDFIAEGFDVDAALDRMATSNSSW